MKTYYKDDAVTIVNGDCLEVMQHCKDQYFDLVITDPPYNVNFRYKGYDDDMPLVSYMEWCATWFAELQRICKGPIIITPSKGKMGDWLQRLEHPTDILIWYKSNSCTPAPKGVTCFWVWEPIFVYGKPVERLNNDMLVLPNALQPDTGSHPCPKPRPLWAKLVLSFSERGAKIFDPFLGSGTTTLVAKTHDRKALGCDIDEHYCEIAASRCRQEKLF